MMTKTTGTLGSNNSISLKLKLKTNLYSAIKSENSEALSDCQML